VRPRPRTGAADRRRRGRRAAGDRAAELALLWAGAAIAGALLRRLYASLRGGQVGEMAGGARQQAHDLNIGGRSDIRRHFPKPSPKRPSFIPPSCFVRHRGETRTHPRRHRARQERPLAGLSRRYPPALPPRFDPCPACRPACAPAWFSGTPCTRSSPRIPNVASTVTRCPSQDTETAVVADFGT